MEEKDVNAFHQGNFKMPSLRISTPTPKISDEETRLRAEALQRAGAEIGRVLFALGPTELSEDTPGTEEAREAGAHDAMRGAGIVADLKEAWNGSPMGRPPRTHLLGNGSEAIHCPPLIPRIAL